MKKKLLFWGPVLTASGYGEHARQLLNSILDNTQETFDVYVKSVRWGNTPFLTNENGQISNLISLCEKYESNSEQRFDVSVQVTIPNEFQKLADINVCVTAGIEVDKVSPEWLTKVNEVADILVVPSRHSAQAFVDAKYTNSETNEQLVIKKPILIVPEGVDTTIFKNEKVKSQFDLGTKFNFLSVGLGFDKQFGEDRKNLSTLVKLFCEEFKGNKDVGLILKTSIVGNSYLDFDVVKNRINQIKQSTGCGEFPKIHLVHGRMTREEIANLYRDENVHAYVTLTHGEGFGLPVLEAAACGLPVLATDWSGHIDFLEIKGAKKFVPLPYTLAEIPESAVWQGVMNKGSKWANVKEEDTRRLMKKVSLSYEKPKQWAEELSQFVSQSLDEKSLGKRFASTLCEFVEKMSKMNDIVLPQNDAKTAKQKLRDSLGIPDGTPTLLFAMPDSDYELLLSTGTLKVLKKQFPNHFIIVASTPGISDVVKGFSAVNRVIHFEEWMMDLELTESIFDVVMTPNFHLNMPTSNWIKKGLGRHMSYEIASACDIDTPEHPFVPEGEQFDGIPSSFVVLDIRQERGAPEEDSKFWTEVVRNLKKNIPHHIVQLGLESDRHIEGCLDLRAKVTYGQTVDIIGRAQCVIGTNSITTHLAGAKSTPVVMTLRKGFPRTHCAVSRDVIDSQKNMCFAKENVTARNIVSTAKYFTTGDSNLKDWEELKTKIAGYTHLLNAESQGFPYIESIKSMLGFCDQVVVVEGGSTDGTLEKIEAIGDSRIKIIKREWDWNEPGMDGLQKALGRISADIGPNDFLWQQDADEVVHEDDYEKIRKLVDNFPADTDLIHLPVIDLWGSADQVRIDRHSWKWRLSRNNPRITHGINKHARQVNEKTGKVFSRKNMSDGCEYIYADNFEFVPHTGFYTRDMEIARRTDPKKYAELTNKAFSELPSIFHYSWVDLPRKIRTFKSFWNKCWSNLYNDESPLDRFPDVKTEDDVLDKARRLRDGESDKLINRGLQHGTTENFTLSRSNPELMRSWIDKSNKSYSTKIESEIK